MKRVLDFTLAPLCLSLIGASPTPSNSPAVSSTVTAGISVKKPCDGPEFRQFDFWIGRWTVTTKEGKQVGTSEITAVSDDCAIREQWNGAGGTNGTSLNYYDAAGKRWHQDWVGGDGTILHLQGSLEDGAMVLSDKTASAPGAKTNRIVWTPLPEGKVQQEWASSDDDGKTWKTSFLGIYAR